MTHDPLCYCAPSNPVCGCSADPEWDWCVSCNCEVIALVRADERERVRASDALSAYAAALDKARDAVEALEQEFADEGDPVGCDVIRDALAAIDALRGAS